MGDEGTDHGEAPGVSRALERLRLAEARRARRRQGRSGLVESDRSAMRVVLESVEQGVEVTPSVIAARLGLSPASTTALVDRLVEGGLVVVEPHPRDRRKKLVRPTDDGLDPDHLDPLTVRLRDVAEALTDADARVVQAFLEVVAAAVEDPTLPEYGDRGAVVTDALNR